MTVPPFNVISEGLAGDRVRVRVQLCHFLILFEKVHTVNCSYKKKEKNLFQNSVRWQILL